MINKKMRQKQKHMHQWSQIHTQRESNTFSHTIIIQWFRSPDVKRTAKRGEVCSYRPVSFIGSLLASAQFLCGCCVSDSLRGEQMRWDSDTAGWICAYGGEEKGETERMRGEGNVREDRRVGREREGEMVKERWEKYSRMRWKKKKRRQGETAFTDRLLLSARLQCILLD